jgi:ferredoxin
LLTVNILLLNRVIAEFQGQEGRNEGSVDMRIVVDTDQCTGHGICESLAPDVFEVGDDGIVHLLMDDLPADRRATFEAAVAECPTQSLTLED